jgi:YggT family protein
MNVAVCDLAQLLVWAVNIYTLVLLVYAVFSWIPDLRGSRVEWYLAKVVEPLLVPIRRIIPPALGIDIAFLVLILVLQLVIRTALVRLEVNTCAAAFY